MRARRPAPLCPGTLLPPSALGSTRSLGLEGCGLAQEERASAATPAETHAGGWGLFLAEWTRSWGGAQR